MSGLVATSNKKRKRSSKKRGILKQREPTNGGVLSGEAGARTNYESGQTPADRRARFNKYVQIRQTSDGGNREQRGVKGTARFSKGDLGPEGAFKTLEEMEASNKQRDIDYVFVYVVHTLVNKPSFSQIKSNIIKFSVIRSDEESKRNRNAYTPTEKDIYQKCVEILAKLETEDSRVDVKAGVSTLTFGDGGVDKIWVTRLKNYLDPEKLAAAASGKREGGKRGLADKTTLIF